MGDSNLFTYRDGHTADRIRTFEVHGELKSNKRNNRRDREASRGEDSDRTSENHKTLLMGPV